MTLHEKHMVMIDAVNEAKDPAEHHIAEAMLAGWRMGVRAAGFEPDLIAADLEQFGRGHESRPMCCGVFNDWKVEGKKGLDE